MANSSRFVLPIGMAPAANSRSTTVAVYGGRQPSRIFDEQVVGTPSVHRLSLSATGTPARGSFSPRAQSLCCCFSIFSFPMPGYASVVTFFFVTWHATGVGPLNLIAVVQEFRSTKCYYAVPAAAKVAAVAAAAARLLVLLVLLVLMPLLLLVLVLMLGHVLVQVLVVVAQPE